jgi:two-component system cell cycle sensor histidine kinase/response regulator CckA
MSHDEDSGQLRAEEARRLLEESEQRYREIFETNPAIKLVIDPDTGNIEDANASACAFYGWDKQTLCSMRIQDINMLSDDRIRQEMDRARQERRLFFYFKHRTASGEVKDVEVYTGPITAGGRQLLHSIIIDVSERKRLRDQLLQAQRMEAVGRMAGGVAHDFNNLLTVVLTCVELARGSLPSNHPAADAVSEIEAAALRGAELTQQLLALARKRIVEPQVIELSVVVGSMHALLRRLIGEHVDISFEGDESAWNTEADPAQIEQVVVNLVVNARDAMPHGGSIRVGIRNLEAKTASADLPVGRWVVLSVIDDGVGMSREVQERIFEPFFTTKPHGEGTGLGLSTVFGIVRQAGGHVRVESEPGKGSRFFVYLPAVDRAVTVRAPVDEPEPAPAEAAVILVVEDDDAIRRLLGEALLVAGFTVLTAADGEHAVEVYRGHGRPIDLLLTDVVMPKQNGPELARLLRAEQPDLPIVLMSGYPSDLSIDPASLGATFLAKPFSTQVLLQLVRTKAKRDRSQRD